MNITQNEKRCVIKNQTLDNSDENLKEFNLNKITCKILSNRGFKNIIQLRKFLSPQLHQLYDPFLLLDMEDAIYMIKKTIDSKGKIIIYGDYDADGITSTSILYLCLKSIGANVDFYIPNRVDEGYGLSTEAIKSIIENNVSLIITVDCGISSVEEVQYCKNAGVNIIITDHHECKEVIPDTIVINPKRYDSNYPFKDLAGVGVAFKLIQGLSTIYNNIDIINYLELTAIGTIADIVSIMDENRIIVKYGLKQLKNSSNPGIKALLENINIISDDINAGQVSFIIAPKINAIGRIADAKIGVELFTSDNEEVAIKLAIRLNHENKKRQEIEENILSQAEIYINDKIDIDKDYVFVLCSEDWHIGVIGIVASRLVEKYYKPVVILNREGNIYRGSARSIPGFNIFKSFCQCSDLLIKFGGHEQAAGLSITCDNIKLFKDRINNIARGVFLEKTLSSSISIDCEINSEDISLKLIDEIAVLEPFGIGNPSPVFNFNCVNIEGIKTVGIQNKHLKLKVSRGCETFDAIAFHLGYNINCYSKNNTIDVLCGLGKNVWNGQENVQLMVKDIKPSKFMDFEDDYYKSLKNMIEVIKEHSDDNFSYFNKFDFTDMSLEQVLDNTFNNKSTLILLSNISNLKRAIHYNSNNKIVLGNYAFGENNNTMILVNPDLPNINFNGISDVYIIDSLIDCKYINDYHMKNHNSINWHICRFKVIEDISFINTIFPDRSILEKLFIYLKKLSINRTDHINLLQLSSELSIKTLTTYYCLKILNEINVITISINSNIDMVFKINTGCKKSLDESNMIGKFNMFINNLKNINKYFQEN